MSVVWRAQDEVLARPVAVKVIKAEPGSNTKFADRVRREARALARINHRHIADVYDCGDSDAGGGPAPYLVMELVEGETLGDVLRRGPLPPPAAITIAAQVASALAAAHAAGVVHCDVTPGNVMLAADGVKIIDFGIACTSGDKADGVMFGTPAYLAPERRSGGRAMAASDVYGLGLLLYEMLTGRLPWPDVSASEIVTAHRSVPPAPLPEIPGLPDGVAELCTACLGVDPTGRPSSRDLSAVLGGISRAGDRLSRRTLAGIMATIGRPEPAVTASTPATPAGIPVVPAGIPAVVPGAGALGRGGGAAQHGAIGGVAIAAAVNGSAARGAAVNGVAVNNTAFSGGAVNGGAVNGGPIGAVNGPANAGAAGMPQPALVRNRNPIMPHGVTSLPDSGRVTEPIDERIDWPPRRRRPFFALPSRLFVVLLARVG